MNRINWSTTLVKSFNPFFQIIVKGFFSEWFIPVSTLDFPRFEDTSRQSWNSGKSLFLLCKLRKNFNFDGLYLLSHLGRYVYISMFEKFDCVLIFSRYLLKALDMYWHEDCLKCGCCDCRLGEVGSTLYTKGNLLLCKRDYLRYLPTMIIQGEMFPREAYKIG